MGANYMQELPEVQGKEPIVHPLDQTLEDPAAANADHALKILRTLPNPISDLDLNQLTEWARRQRAERLALR